MLLASAGFVFYTFLRRTNKTAFFACGGRIYRKLRFSLRKFYFRPLFNYCFF